LKRIYINEKEINKEKITLEKFEYPIGSDQYNLIRPRNEERNIDFSFSYYKNYKTALKLRMYQIFITSSQWRKKKMVGVSYCIAILLICIMIEENFNQIQI
jgi:hypothetical protein